MTTPRPPDPQREDPHGDLRGDPREIRFFELASAAGRSVLEPLADAWRAAGARTDLLASLDRADLWLLVVRGGREEVVDAPHDPELRTWRFREVTS